MKKILMYIVGFLLGIVAFFGGIGLVAASGVPQSIGSPERPFLGDSNVPLAIVGGVLILIAMGSVMAFGVAMQNDMIDRLRGR